jgi:hypothetical protein
MSCEGEVPTFTEDINAYYSINFPNLRQGDQDRHYHVSPFKAIIGRPQP